MLYDVKDIVRDVRQALDENKDGKALLDEGDLDTLTLDILIRSKVEEASRRVGMSAPVSCLEHGHLIDGAVYWREDGSGWVLLPDDFMRLIAFKMSDWSRACYTTLPVHSAKYALQSSRYAGIRGDVQKPVCVLVYRNEGKALEFHSSNSRDAYVTMSSYLPYPKIDSRGCIDLSERCYPAIVYTTASLVLTACGSSEQAAQLSALAQSIFENE